MADKTTGKLKLWIAKITDKISDTINIYLNENFSKIDDEFSSLKDGVDEHKADDTKHITSTERTIWNNKLDASAYTAADVLAKVKTVDGDGSGLDADLLDGAHAGNGPNNVLKLDSGGFVPLPNIPGTLTGKSADMVDGKHFSDIQNDAQAKVDTHASLKQTHGISSGYYIAKTSRSDQLPDWNDIQGKPNLSLASDLAAHNAEHLRIEIGVAPPENINSKTFWLENLGESIDFVLGGGLLIGNASTDGSDDVWFDENV